MIGEWSIRTLNGVDVSAWTITTRFPPADTTKVATKGACNDFVAPFEYSGDEMQMKADVEMSAVLCAPQLMAVDEQIATLLYSLGQRVPYRVEGDTLSLAGGQATYQRVQPGGG